jgi:hypothetical protein
MVPDEAVVDADTGGKPPLRPAATNIFASPLRVNFASLNYRRLVSG